ncbi:MAG: cell envelope integrity protein TolA [Deltaproteobacteria bacterium]|jgi:colicin import membrane protein|nr:cell envelope integrity protein TolA [Deltaproteobacteria bacterium]
MVEQKQKERSYFWGILTSLILHIVVAVSSLLHFKNVPPLEIIHPEVFSVTLEGGEKLGGISQVPQVEKVEPAPLAPLHNIDQSGPAPEKVEELPKIEEPESEQKIEGPTVIERDEEEERRKKEEAEKKRLEEELKKQAEKKKKAEKEALEKLEREKKLAEERKKKEELEKKKKAEIEAKKKAEEEKKKAEKEAKEKAEKEKKAKAEAEKKAKLEREKELKKAIEQAKNRAATGTGTGNTTETAGTKGVKSNYLGESANAGGEGFGAAKLGGKGMGGGTLASVEFIAYRNALERHIKNGWHWIAGADRLIAQVLVNIDQDGKVQSATIAVSSGSVPFDESVLRAIQKASPVPPAPENLYEQFKSVRMTFDSKE